MDGEVMVSVICLTYNHAKYISRCLNSLVSQITSFRYEVIVHDDASTDGTTEIVREYAEKYPDIIIPIIQSDNKYSKKVPITKCFVDRIVRGKYRALCEGDDCWIDVRKLQKQFDVMESNQNCSMCVHMTTCVDSNGNRLNRLFPEIDLQEGILPSQSIIDKLPVWLFQSSSYFVRESCYRKMLHLDTDLYEAFPVGDMRYIYSMAAFGDFYYIRIPMSSYTVMAENSWTSMQSNDKVAVFCGKMKKMEYKYIEYLQSERSDISIKNITDNVIPYYSFYEALYKKEYHIVSQKQYRAFFRTLGKKHQLKIMLLAHSPFLSIFFDGEK